jgi:hypothetical protein
MPTTESLKVIARRIKELQAEAAEIERNEQEGIERLRAVIERYGLRTAHFKLAMRGIGCNAARPRPWKIEDGAKASEP